MPNSQSTLDAALALARRGFYVFPCVVKGESKKPSIKNWKTEATRDEAKIRTWWNGEFERCAVGIAHGKFGDGSWYLVTFDCDNKHGKNGADRLFELELEHGDLPRTYTQRTQSGGLHYVFKTRHPLDGPADFRPGLDIRGARNLIYAAGSVWNGKAYTVEVDADVAEAPEWVVDLVGVRSVDEPRVGAPEGLILDTPEAVAAAVAYINTESPEGQSGNRDAPAFKTAAGCRDFALTPEKTLELMDEYWNGVRCVPAMDLDRLEEKVANAYKSASSTIGAKAPAAAEMQPAEAAKTTEPPTTQAPAAEPFAIVGYDDPIDTPEPEPLIDGILDKGAAVLLYGLPKTGKSFVLFEMGRCVAGSVKFADRYTEHGAVVIFCFEGHPGLSRRRKAMRLHHGDKNLPLFIVKARGSILSKTTQAQMAATVDTIEARCGQRVVLVGVDTVTAAAPGEDQYAPGPAGNIVNAAKAVSTAHGRTLVLVHHAAKDKGNSPLGSVAFQGSVDAVLKVGKDGSCGKLDGEMMREHAAGQPLEFELRTVHVGTTARGVAVSSAVALFGPATDFTKALTPKEAEVEELVLKLAADCVPGADDEHADIRLAQKDVEDALVNRSDPHKDGILRVRAETAARNAIKHWREKRAQSHNVRVEKHGKANFLCFHPMAFIRTNAEKRAQ